MAIKGLNRIQLQWTAMIWMVLMIDIAILFHSTEILWFIVTNHVYYHSVYRGKALFVLIVVETGVWWLGGLSWMTDWCGHVLVLTMVNGWASWEERVIKGNVRPIIMKPHYMTQSTTGPDNVRLRMINVSNITFNSGW